MEIGDKLKKLSHLVGQGGMYLESVYDHQFLHCRDAEGKFLMLMLGEGSVISICLLQLQWGG